MKSMFAKSLIVLLAVQFITMDCVADDAGSNPAKRNVTPAPLTKEQQVSALKFAQKHHPELATLLKRLQSKSAPEFNRGIRTLHAASVRLEKMKDRQPARFESDLELWKTESQIRLLSAKWLVSPNDRLKKQIQQLLAIRQSARRERIQAEHDRLTERMQVLKSQLDRSPQELKAALQADWDQLTRRARKTKPQKTNNGTSRSDSKTKPKDGSRKKKKPSSESAGSADS